MFFVHGDLISRIESFLSLNPQGDFGDFVFPKQQVDPGNFRVVCCASFLIIPTVSISIKLIDMPLDNNKPPDPIREKFSTLTRMSSERVHHKPFVPAGDGCLPKPHSRPKGVRSHIKSVRVKVQSPGSASAGAGAILKRLRNSKMVGKGKSRDVSSPHDIIDGKCPASNNIPVDDVLSKVLDRIAYNKNISEQMVFNEGIKNCDLKSSKSVKSDCLIYGNDGSFIKDPIEPVVSKVDVLGSYLENKDGGVDFFNNIMDPCLVSNDASSHNMADVEHVVDESVMKANNNALGGEKGGFEFVFGMNQGNKGILKFVNFSSVHFGPSLFHKLSSANAWSKGGAGIKNGNLDSSLNIEPFAEKMKKGMEDKELQITYVPQCVSKQENGVTRIEFIEEDIKKGSVACALQLYKYFVGTSMDYRVVNANLSRMWRVYGISDITKTNSGLEWGSFRVVFNIVDDNDDGFVTVCKKNRLVQVQSNINQRKEQFRSGKNASKGGMHKIVSVPKFSMEQGSKRGVVKNAPINLSKFKPRVLVNGSSSSSIQTGVMAEDVLVSNSFHVLDDKRLMEKEKIIVDTMDEEYENVIWPKLMQELILVMETGVYPSMAVRMEWSLAQMDYFYNNCHKFGLDPNFEDDDVQTEDGGMADEMRPEYVDDVTPPNRVAAK
ncbi:hypothetical protein Tco_1353586 [Tanacetum coccineum]